MFVGHTKLKLSPCTLIIMTLIVFTLTIGLVSIYYGAEKPIKDSSLVVQQTVPLLLNSGEVQAEEADISIILWLKNGNIPKGAWTKPPTPDWTWTYNELKVGSELVAVTLSGHQMIDKNEEIDLYQWYTTMSRELAKTDGMIYIDERVDQAMDISAYLSKTNAYPAQWALIGNMISIAAYQNSFSTSVLAGQDRINIQLLSRGKNNEGRTVLAIPALLKEF